MEVSSRSSRCEPMRVVKPRAEGRRLHGSQKATWLGYLAAVGPWVEVSTTSRQSTAWTATTQNAHHDYLATRVSIQ
jgi:hypothetical protein